MTVLKKIMIYLLIAWATVLLIAFFFADNMAFFPQKASYQDAENIIKISSTDGVQISASYIKNPSAHYTILFSHGNAEDIGDVHPFLQKISNLGFSLFAYDYQGYGTSEGIPTEQHAYDDIFAAFNYMVEILHIPPERIIVHGRSIGGAMSTKLAAKKKIAGLILESTLSNASDVLWIGKLVPWKIFNSIDRLQRITCPVLVIHGAQDRVISFDNGKKLFHAAHDPKMNLWINKASHNDVFYTAEKQYIETLKEFEQMILRTQAVSATKL